MRYRTCGAHAYDAIAGRMFGMEPKEPKEQPAPRMFCPRCGSTMRPDASCNGFLSSESFQWDICKGVCELSGLTPGPCDEMCRFCLLLRRSPQFALTGKGYDTGQRLGDAAAAAPHTWREPVRARASAARRSFKISSYRCWRSFPLKDA